MDFDRMIETDGQRWWSEDWVEIRASPFIAPLTGEVFLHIEPGVYEKSFDTDYELVGDPFAVLDDPHAVQVVPLKSPRRIHLPPHVEAGGYYRLVSVDEPMFSDELGLSAPWYVSRVPGIPDGLMRLRTPRPKAVYRSLDDEWA